MSPAQAIAPLIKVDVEPYFIEQREVNDEAVFVFGYHITINNQSPNPVQLLTRHWFITDSDGNQIEVKGEGVVGLQPVIEANGHFKYSSGSNFKTPVGTMHGYYEMIDKEENQSTFQVPIHAFRLADETTIH